MRQDVFLWQASGVCVAIQTTLGSSASGLGSGSSAYPPSGRATGRPPSAQSTCLYRSWDWVAFPCKRSSRRRGGAMTLPTRTIGKTHGCCYPFHSKTFQIQLEFAFEACEDHALPGMTGTYLLSWTLLRWRVLLCMIGQSMQQGLYDSLLCFWNVSHSVAQACKYGSHIAFSNIAIARLLTVVGLSADWARNLDPPGTANPKSTSAMSTTGMCFSTWDWGFL